MSCNNPFTINKNGILYQVPCNYCQGCRKDILNSWSDRIRFEQVDFAKKGQGSSFVTLTYRSETLPDDFSVSLSDVQLFNKRLRKKLSKTPIKYKYFIASEYGSDNFRPHYHCIFLGLSTEFEDLIRKTWDKGFIDVKPLTHQAIRYCLKYITCESKGKQLEDIYFSSGVKPPFHVMSKGIGRQYLLDNIDILKEKYGYYRQGRFVKIPKYYKDLLGIKPPVETENYIRLKKEAQKNGYSDVQEFYHSLQKSRETSLIAKARKNAKPVDKFSVYHSAKKGDKLAHNVTFNLDYTPVEPCSLESLPFTLNKNNEKK